METQTGKVAVTRAATILFQIALLVCLRSQAQAQRADDPQRDTQIWPDTTVTIKLRPDISFIIHGTARFGRDSSALVNEQAGAGFSKSFGRNFSAGIFYRFINSEPTPNRRSGEHRIFLDLTPRKSLGKGFTLQDRNRIEWRDVNKRISWRYRNRLQFERPISINERKITPYFAVEPMYDTRFRAWSRTQMYIGTRIPLIKHVTFDGFYMRQFDARTRPGFLNVVGAYWRLEF